MWGPGGADRSCTSTHHVPGRLGFFSGVNFCEQMVVQRRCTHARFFTRSAGTFSCVAARMGGESVQPLLCAALRRLPWLGHSRGVRR